MSKLNGHSLNGHGHGEAAMSADLKARDNPFAQLLPNGKSRKVARMIAARDRFALASDLLERAEKLVTRAAGATEPERKSLEAIANEYLMDASKLRQEAQEIVSRLK